MQNQAYFLFRLGNKRQMPYFFQFSQGENIRFPYGNPTFPEAET